jgi:hypothetical protein
VHAGSESALKIAAAISDCCRSLNVVVLLGPGATGLYRGIRREFLALRASLPT